MTSRMTAANCMPGTGFASLMCWLLIAALSTSVAAAAEERDEAQAPPGTLEFVGKNLLMKARGIFHEWRVVESSIDMEAIEEAFAVVEVSLSSVDTGIERRDEHLRTPDFFDVETYPVARIRVHSPQPVAAEEDEKSRFSIRFDVDLHGVQKTLEGEIVLMRADPLVFEGEVVIDRTEFGVGPKPNRWNPMSPRAEIPIRFHVEI